MVFYSAAFFQGDKKKWLQDRKDGVGEEEPVTLATCAHQVPYATGLSTTRDEFSVNLGSFIFYRKNSILQIYVISS